MSHMDMRPKAYQVTDRYEGYSTIVFARHGIVARREGANELNIEFDEVESCRRVPGLDSYAEREHVPPKVLIEDMGWYFECTDCGQHITEDTEHAVYEGDMVFCSSWHWLTFKETLARRRYVKRQAEALTRVKWPAIDGVVSVHGVRSELAGTSVGFTFGGKSAAHWIVGEATVNIIPSDMEAWNDFNALCKRMRGDGHA